MIRKTCGIGALLVIFVLYAVEQKSFAEEPPHAQNNRIHISKQAVAESPDFATLQLRDPWDMSEYSDISQYINESGQRELVADIDLSGGIFSGRSVGDGASGANAYFFPLFPGYWGTMQIGKIGSTHPIDAQKYKCLFAAMKVDSGGAVPGMGPDQWRVFWFEDVTLNAASASWGLGVSALYPEAGSAKPTPFWKLYRMDLDNPPISPEGYTKWNGSSTWQGLRIDPTVQAGVEFAVDWVRLTDCTAHTTTVTWTPDRSVTALWLQPVGGAVGDAHYIRVATNVAGASGTHELDTQGLQAGEYSIGLGTNTTCCVHTSAETLLVSAAPIVEFVSPSQYSGADFATTAGNSWGFEDTSDIRALRNADYVLTDGLLDITTQSGPTPAGNDVQVDLHVPLSAELTKYRYLSIYLYTEWDAAWQDVVSGMIGRWVWTIPSMTGETGSLCQLVSQDIPLDVGWHLYTIDLHHYFNGAAEETYPVGNPHCPAISYSPQEPPQDIAANPAHWLNVPAAIQFRFDPNENISCDFRQQPGKSHIPCSSYRQRIDWIALTAVDQVNRGDAYSIVMDLNKQMDPSQVSVYYTTDLADPRQNRAQEYSGSSQPSLELLEYPIYLPTTFRSSSNAGASVNFVTPRIPLNVQWDTASVTPGAYFICVEANDGLNRVVSCSEAPIQVVP